MATIIEFRDNLAKNIDWENLDYDQIRLVIKNYKDFEKVHSELLN